VGREGGRGEYPAGAAARAWPIAIKDIIDVEGPTRLAPIAARELLLPPPATMRKVVLALKKRRGAIRPRQGAHHRVRLLRSLTRRAILTPLGAYAQGGSSSGSASWR